MHANAASTAELKYTAVHHVQKLLYLLQLHYNTEECFIARRQINIYARKINHPVYADRLLVATRK